MKEIAGGEGESGELVGAARKYMAGWRRKEGLPSERVSSRNFEIRFIGSVQIARPPARRRHVKRDKCLREAEREREKERRRRVWRAAVKIQRFSIILTSRLSPIVAAPPPPPRRRDLFNISNGITDKNTFPPSNSNAPTR